ncbi:hypothetical protein ACFZBU_43830 [Embleya sp. NPDC008237]|uniref:hypothetical protein n=1 Tax=Embleya sp. NPDC008237 TaxID=3363978 RepID=UPI0036E77CCC
MLSTLSPAQLVPPPTALPKPIFNRAPFVRACFIKARFVRAPCIRKPFVKTISAQTASLQVRLAQKVSLQPLAAPTVSASTILRPLTSDLVIPVAIPARWATIPHEFGALTAADRIIFRRAIRRPQTTSPPIDRCRVGTIARADARIARNARNARNILRPTIALPITSIGITRSRHPIAGQIIVPERALRTTFPTRTITPPRGAPRAATGPVVARPIVAGDTALTEIISCRSTFARMFRVAVPALVALATGTGTGTPTVDSPSAPRTRVVRFPTVPSRLHHVRHRPFADRLRP